MYFHRLDFTAIGSYPGNVIVDFDSLAPFGLFHIHGPTGAGKSSLLDALCFALYGTVASPRRADGLRSHHAIGSVEAIASLEFSSQGTTWRIVRTPTQYRAKRRGSGHTEQRATATLHRRNNETWSPVASGVKEVDVVVAQITGLDAEQFMQVVVLPQGSFQRVLRAGADEREALLRSLFHTERFGDYAKQLRRRADESAVEMKTLIDARESAAQRVRMALSNFDLPAAVVDELDDITDARLATLTTKTNEFLANARAEVKSSSTCREVAEQKAQAARLQTERWQRRVGAETQLATLTTEKETIDVLRTELHQAQRAAPIAPLIERLDELRDQRNRSLRHRQQIHKQLVSQIDHLPEKLRPAGLAIREITTTEALKADLEAARSPLRSALRELHRRFDRQQQAAKVAVDLERHRRQEHALADQQATASQEVVSSRAKVDDLERQIVDTRHTASQLSEREDAIKTLADRVDAAERLNILHQHLDRLRRDLMAVESEAIAAQEHHLELIKRRLGGMAGELAETLTLDDPCPVCGSPDHPAPAKRHDPVTPEEVDFAATQMSLARQKADSARREIETAQDDLQKLSERAGPASDDPLSLKSALDEAQRDLRRSQEASISLAQQEETFQSMKEQTAGHERRVQKLTNDIAIQQSTQATLLSQIEELTSHTSIDELDELAKELTRTTEQLDALEGVNASLESLAKTNEDVERLDVHIERDRTKLDEEIDTRALGSPQDAQAAYRHESDCRKLEARIQQWDNAIAQVRHTLDEPGILEAVEQPDLAAAVEATRIASSEHEVAIANFTRAESAAHQLNEAREELQQTEATIAPLQEHHERLVRLAELSAGVRSNDRRMSLERYVLAAFLEEVAAAASRRLELMTSGRYRLRHSDARVRGNAASGLSLLVSDAYTGIEREVSTLSGGETFLASLALALGLADVVQQHSGGVHIDALFVDEGFGSLDADALELAMTELDRLREGGRLVGIISHVPALRERIHAGIEVIAGTQGSTIRMLGVGAPTPQEPVPEDATSRAS